MRSLSLWRMFSSSPSTLYNPDDWGPSVSTTLSNNTLASEKSISWGAAAWWRCGGGSLWHYGMSVSHSGLALSACFPFESPSLCVWLLLLQCWTACCFPGMRDGWLGPVNRETEWEEAKINSSLNKSVKPASKGVHHLLWHSWQFDAAVRGCVTWQIVCMNMLLLLSSTWSIVRPSLPSLANTED